LAARSVPRAEFISSGETILSDEHKIPILYFWADPADAERLVHELAKTGVKFEAKLVKTHVEYVSALVRAKFVLIVADEKAETAGASEDELSLYEIAAQISPGTAFVRISDRDDAAAGSAGYTTITRSDLHRLKDIIDRALNDPH
jgi:hypothetical protein